MITIYNINEHTLQEVYDQIARHLLTQGKRALTVGKCVYHACDGSKCAIGSLIPDKLYDPIIEGYQFSDVFLSNGIVINDDLVRLLDVFRVLHDDYEPHEWSSCLHDIAKIMNLSSEVVSCYT